MGGLSIQREFICRHIKVSETSRKTKGSGSETKRKSSKSYFLQIAQDQRVRVSQKMFLNTFDISEKTTRTALEKCKILEYFLQTDEVEERKAPNKKT